MLLMRSIWESKKRRTNHKRIVPDDYDPHADRAAVGRVSGTTKRSFVRGEEKALPLLLLPGTPFPLLRRAAHHYYLPTNSLTRPLSGRPHPDHPGRPRPRARLRSPPGGASPGRAAPRVRVGRPGDVRCERGRAGRDPAQAHPRARVRRGHARGQAQRRARHPHVDGRPPGEGESDRELGGLNSNSLAYYSITSPERNLEEIAARKRETGTTTSNVQRAKGLLKTTSWPLNHRSPRGGRRPVPYGHAAPLDARSQKLREKGSRG